MASFNDSSSSLSVVLEARQQGCSGFPLDPFSFQNACQQFVVSNGLSSQCQGVIRGSPPVCSVSCVGYALQALPPIDPCQYLHVVGPIYGSGSFPGVSIPSIFSPDFNRACQLSCSSRSFFAFSFDKPNRWTGLCHCGGGIPSAARLQSLIPQGFQLASIQGELQYIRESMGNVGGGVVVPTQNIPIGPVVTNTPGDGVPATFVGGPGSGVPGGACERMPMTGFVAVAILMAGWIGLL
ncbi:hypothetical protein BC829DRAFT_401221 [Chytridium lagenaria]|nr:hypothetical protein BC829DRAFT_401221 [Chytridium lagenaria]